MIYERSVAVCLMCLSDCPSSMTRRGGRHRMVVGRRNLRTRGVAPLGGRGPEAPGPGTRARSVLQGAVAVAFDDLPGDIWLTTPTWIHVAIGLYLPLGFCAHKTYRLGGRDPSHGRCTAATGVCAMDRYGHRITPRIRYSRDCCAKPPLFSMRRFVSANVAARPRRAVSASKRARMACRLGMGI